MSLQFQQRTMLKEYYCRVVGNFPEGEVVVDKAILVVSPRHGLNRLREGGKPSTTKFERLFYDEERDQSVVLAKPLTGRTHQIRYHWLYFCHPNRKEFIYNIWATPSRTIPSTPTPKSSKLSMRQAPQPTKSSSPVSRKWASQSHHPPAPTNPIQAETLPPSMALKIRKREKCGLVNYVMYVGHTSILIQLPGSSRFGFMRGSIVGKSQLRKGWERSCCHLKVRFRLGARRGGQGISHVLGVLV